MAARNTDRGTRGQGRTAMRRRSSGALARFDILFAIGRAPHIGERAARVDELTPAHAVVLGRFDRLALEIHTLVDVSLTLALARARSRRTGNCCRSWRRGGSKSRRRSRCHCCSDCSRTPRRDRRSHRSRCRRYTCPRRNGRRFRIACRCSSCRHRRPAHADRRRRHAKRRVWLHNLERRPPAAARVVIVLFPSRTCLWCSALRRACPDRFPACHTLPQSCSSPGSRRLSRSSRHPCSTCRVNSCRWCTGRRSRSSRRPRGPRHNARVRNAQFCRTGRRPRTTWGMRVLAGWLRQCSSRRRKDRNRMPRGPRRTPCRHWRPWTRRSGYPCKRLDRAGPGTRTA